MAAASQDAAPAELPSPGSQPGAPSPAGDVLAGLWLSALEGLAARAAHEHNNALNGLAMNLEVLRMTVRPGADGTRAAPFVAAAGEALAEAMAVGGALVDLARTPRDPAARADVRTTLREVAAVLGPVGAAQDRVTLARDGVAGDPAPTRAGWRAVRLAVVAALTAGLAAAGEGSETGAGGAETVEPDGASLADEPARLLRCMLVADPAPTLQVTPGASMAPGIRAALADAGITVEVGGGALTLRFPPP